MAITTKGVTRQPITGSRKEMRAKLPQTNPQNQSRQAQSQLSAPPAPFKNPGSAAQQPTGRRNASTIGQPYGNTSAPGPAPTRSPGVPVMSTKEMLAAVGYSQPTNYAGRGGPNGLYATGPVTGGRGVTRATKAAKAKYPGLFGSNRYKRG